MKKTGNWVVDCRGEMEAPTRGFDTEREARRYFNTIRLALDPDKFLFSNDFIVEKGNEKNAIYLLNLQQQLHPLSPLADQPKSG